MTRLAVIGAGDLGHQLAHHGRACGFEIAGFFDDMASPGLLPSGIDVLGPIDAVEACHRQGGFDSLLVGIGYKHPELRHQLFQRFGATIPFARLVHPSAVVDATCSIGAGAVIYPGCVLDMGVCIGANALLNIGCVIAHDSRIGPGCFLSPAVRIAGFVEVGECAILGIGTIVIDHVSIAAGTRTGAGAVVVKDLPTPGLYLGVPARLKKGT